MDIKKLQTILMLKGIRITDDDPIFVLVALNEIVLEEMTKKIQHDFSSSCAKPILQSARVWFQTAVVSTLTFGIGLLIGTRSMPVLQAGIGLVLGVMIGAILVVAIYIKMGTQHNLSAEQSQSLGLGVVKQKLWTEEEFKRVAANARITERTLAACQEVLVDGKAGVDAAKNQGIMEPQISRGLKFFRENR